MFFIVSLWPNVQKQITCINSEEDLDTDAAI